MKEKAKAPKIKIKEKTLSSEQEPSVIVTPEVITRNIEATYEREAELERPEKKLRKAKTPPQDKAWHQPARDPDMQEFVDMVLESEYKEKEREKNPRLAFARKKNKRELLFANAMATAERYRPDFNIGLTSEQVAERKAKALNNFAPKSNAKTYGSIFFQNIFTFFNLLCAVVAVALLFAKTDIANYAFLVIMLANLTISVVLEVRAKWTIEKISLISAPVAVVVRGGEKLSVAVNEVVLDDIIFLENGKQICTDCIVLDGELEVNESLLTGESNSVTKKAGSQLFAGSFVTSGSCYARADKVASDNYIESLTAFAKRYRKPKSELLDSLKAVIKVIGLLIVPIAIALIFTNLRALRVVNPDARLAEAFPMTAGAVIGMIPSGMFLLTSTSLAISVVRLFKNNVLVQDLYCIEMLARVNVLCLDKTGTITDGTMQVNEIIEFKNNNDTGVSLGNIIGSCLTATGDNNQTSIALVNEFGYSKSLKPQTVMPFSSQRKFSAVTFEDSGTFFMGAPEFIIKDMGVRLETLINDKAKEGLRVLLVAHSPHPIKKEKPPSNPKAIALIVIEDHIREDAFETLRWFRENDVAIKIISGDNPLTVSEVAKRVGVPYAEKYVSLDGMTDPEVVELANQYTVFGRVTPEQKRLLIKSMKAQGNTVGMTGDGVNDILALKEADCAVAIASGSEAARNVSHMVLRDSNFANMPQVVMEGRRVINNIQKASSLFLMKTLFSMLLSLLVVVMQIRYPFEPKNLIIMEFFIIGMPSFFLAFQTNRNRIQGRIMLNMLKNAVPSGLALVFTFITLLIFASASPATFGVFTEGAKIADVMASPQFRSASVLIATFTGVVMLFRLCLPLDPYRFTVWSVAALGCVCLSVFMGSIFDIIRPNLTLALLVIVIVMSSYILVTVIQTAITKIKVN